MLALSDIRTTFTDAKGDCRLEGITPGQPVIAVALSPFYVAGQSKPHNIPPFETRQAEDIVLRKGGFLHISLPPGMRGTYNLQDCIPPGQSEVSETLPSFSESILETQRTQAITPGEWTAMIEWKILDGSSAWFTRDMQVTIRAGVTIPLDLTGVTEPTED